MAIFDFGDGPALYLTGADNTGPEPIFRWTGGPAWTVVSEELTGTISAITSFDDGTGPELYVAGEARPPPPDNTLRAAYSYPNETGRPIGRPVDHCRFVVG